MFRCEKCLNEYTKEFDACPMCGGKIFPYEKQIDPVTANEIETAKQEAVERAERRTKVLTSELAKIKSRLKQGNPVYLHNSFYVTIDSEVEAGGGVTQFNPFDDSRVIQAGLDGWRIVGVAPRTKGSALQNYEGFAKAWAGGIGGNVVGVYVMMEYELTEANLQDSMSIVEHVLTTAYKL